MESGEPPRNCVLLTGLPRSGTTLTCHLLNKLPDTVALHEPLDVARLGNMADAGSRVRELGLLLGQMRDSLLTTGTARSKHVGGIVPDNSRSPDFARDGLRKTIAKRGDVDFRKTLSEDFTLVIKHPSFFSALLGEVSRLYPCYAVIRNPLSVLGSWNTVDMAVRRGHIPAAERVDRKLSATLDALEDEYERQIYVLGWFFRQFVSFLPEQSIIRYENIVASGGRELAVINPVAATLDEKLESRNRSTLYDTGIMQKLGARLLRSDGDYWKFYSRDDVKGVMER